MAETGDYIVVHLVDRLPIGARFQRKRLSWPLHITLISWFAAADESALIASLQKVADSTPAFEALVGPIDQFGADAEIPVNIIADAAELHALHDRLRQALAAVSVVYRSTQWHGAAYRPHITRHDHTGHFKSAGEHIQVADFHLVHLTGDNTCEVVRQFDFRSET